MDVRLCTLTVDHRGRPPQKVVDSADVLRYEVERSWRRGDRDTSTSTEPLVNRMSNRPGSDRKTHDLTPLVQKLGSSLLRRSDKERPRSPATARDCVFIPYENKEYERRPPTSLPPVLVKDYWTLMHTDLPLPLSRSTGRLYSQRIPN